MSKQLRRLVSIHEAAVSLHNLLVGNSWYIRTQVLIVTAKKGPVVDKDQQQEIVVYVKDGHQLNNAGLFNMWPVRYEVGG